MSASVEILGNFSRVTPFRSIQQTGGAILAPMSGITDLGLRRAALHFGADLVVTEMVAAESYVAADEEARLRAERGGPGPHVVQIAGCRPGPLAEAARLAEAAGADAIDINMGCPAKRVVGGFAGSALMRDLDLATSLIRAVIDAVGVAVSVKMRLGWDDSSRNAPELARRAEAEGAELVTIHGRTRQQFYKGFADWTAIRAVKQAVSIPVVANGDGADETDARTMLDASGADAVMVGRAAVGRPWLVGRVGAALRGETYAEPPAKARCRAAIDHYETLLTGMGVQQGLRHARKHLAAYASAAEEDGYRIDPVSRRHLVTSENPAEVIALLNSVWSEPMERLAA